MAGGKRGGLVEEEQLGVAAGRHHRSPAAFELQQAGYPAPAYERAHDPLGGIVKAAATVSHQGAALRGRDQLAEWRDAILSRQRIRSIR
jgi:hypothetical protein